VLEWDAEEISLITGGWSTGHRPRTAPPWRLLIQAAFGIQQTEFA
jgi:hypothetical protein